MIMQLTALRFFPWVLCLFMVLPAHGSDAIKVGFSASLTGRYAEPGRKQYRGIEMWAADLNSRGALLGRPVELVHYDDASSPDKAVEIYERLISDDRVDLLIGPYASDMTLAASTVAERHGFPMVAAGAAAEEIWGRQYRNIFGVISPAGEYMDRVIRFAQLQGLGRIALLHADTSFTREVAAGVRREAMERDMTVVFDELYGETTDFSALAQRINRTRPDLVIGATYENAAYALLRAAKAQDLSPKIFAFTVAPALSAFGDTLGVDADGVMGPVAWMHSERIPMAHDFSYRYKARYGNDASYHAAYGYGAGQVLEASVRLAATVDRDAVREQLANMTFISLLGRYRVDATGMQIGEKIRVMQWQDGVRRLVMPERLAERPVRYPFVPWAER